MIKRKKKAVTEETNVQEEQVLNIKRADQYRFIPWTLRNIGCNYLKMGRGPKKLKGEKAQDQNLEYPRQGQQQFQAMKVTPKPEGAFEGKNWDPIHLRERRRLRERAKVAKAMEKRTSK